MPRNPGARKNQHNPRHENGLIQPGKRMVKQRSNPQLNGSAAKVPTPPESVLDSPTLANGVPASPVPGRTEDLAYRTQDSETDGPYPENAKKHDAADNHSMAPVRSSKHKVSHDVSALQIANTILKSRPACDTIALLIVLLALPSMVLTIVQALWAFVSGIDHRRLSIRTGWTVSWDHGLVDAVCFFLWICLWNWAQNFALDLAQIHIAITLGNGSSGKSGSANTICFALVLCLHTIRSKGVRRFVLSNLVPTELLSQTRFVDFLRYLPGDADFGDTPSAPSKLRSLFAIHILSQALVSFIRRQLAGSQTVTVTKSRKGADAEVTAATSTDVNGIDGQGAIGSASGNDYQNSQLTARDGRDSKGVTAKKRRRQANHVRSRQPFWAALASTKVHVLREVENKKGLPNAASVDDRYSDMPQSDNVWIRNVDPSSIHVEARFNAYEDSESDLAPLFVRINGAKWQSVQIEPAQDENAIGNWMVEINGLAPNCTYTCTFHDIETGEDFATVMVRTPVLIDKDYPSTIASTPVRESARPQSPTTTLKNSIASEEGKLSEARKKLAQLKKQHKAGLNKTDRELDFLNGRLKSGGDDNKLRQKLLQTERQIRQTEDNSNNLASTLEGLETVPENEAVEWKDRKAQFEEQKRLLTEATEALSKAKAAADSEIACHNTELSTAVTRQERLAGRVTKLNEQHDRITQANAEGLNEKERREAEFAARQADHQRREKELINSINNLNNQLYETQLTTNEHWHQIEILDKQDQLHRSKMLLNNGPLTPEGDLPGTRSQPQYGRSFGLNGLPPLSGTAEVQESSPMLSYTQPIGSRPRSGTNQSTGGLSGLSEDFDDADPIPPTLQDGANGRKGSGSSRGKNNGSPAHGWNVRSPGRYSPGHIPGTTTW
ncbi:putative ubiquitination network signaling protein acrB [Cyphellophora attinorum]|uniref:Putative ubiquitination network signaling protein acrB n=1 Tax=Cyphellophora attinorum TaxID=1664694 RepID=A0A0N1HAV9_9EURO|nr:putative ubiquitination network signaling protein acrB [Phialophora attinorum]KPI45355.1 putative ubiquitination network signaling protein acrB [Phialophora attinorum]